MNAFEKRRLHFNSDSAHPETDSLWDSFRRIDEIVGTPLSNASSAGMQRNINISLIKHSTAFIPDFDGNNLELRQYIAQVDNKYLEKLLEALK